MAFTRTTLTSAVALQDTQIAVTSATGFAAGTFALIDAEVMKVAQSYTSGLIIPVLRGQDGSVQTTHKTSAAVTAFLASDETGPAGQTVVQFPTGARPRTVQSYSASGAITLPTPGSDLTVILNGAVARLMTLAVPTSDLDGTRLLIVGNGKAAHTVTLAGGLGGGALTVGTATATLGVSVELIAAGGFWCHIGLPSATAAVNAFIWA